MKLIIACLLAGASLSSLSASAAKAPAPKDWCPTGALDKITNIKVDKAGSNDFMNKCKIKGGISLTFDSTLAATEEGAAASTVTLKDSNIGARTIVVVKSTPDQELAKAMIPLKLTIENNVFQTDGHLHIVGAFSPNTMIAITGNKFAIARPLDARFPGGFLNTTAIAISLDEVYMWDQTTIKIANNEISAKDTKGRFELHPIAIRKHMYWYGNNATLDINHNKITAQCAPDLFNNTLCAYGIHGDHTMYMYVKDGKFLVDHNTFNVTGGLLWKMPNFLSHMASVHISTSHNTGYSFSEKNPTSCPVRRYTPFTEFGLLNLGAQTYLNVDYNKFHCKGKSGILGFPTDFTATDHVFASIRGNEISTRGCSPSIYFMNTFALTQKSILWITENVNTRTDKLTSGLASVYYAGEFSIQHDAELTISKNTFGKANTIKHKTKMVGLAPSAINSWKVEEQASIHMCQNIYNGTMLDEEDDLKPHIALKMQEVVIVDECREARRPYSDDFEPGGADDITLESAEFGEDASMEYTKAIIDDSKPEADPDTALDDDESDSPAAAPKAKVVDSPNSEL